MPILIELLIILISTLTLLTAISLYRSHKSKDHRDAPEAKGGWPIFGHLPLFGSKDLMHKKLGSMAEKYGPIFAIRLGSHRAIVVSSWEVAKECLTVHDKAFADRPLITATRLMGYNGAMFGFGPYGEYWREMRKIAMIELLSNHRLDSLKHIRVLEVETAIKDLFKAWIEKGKPRSGVLVEMKSWLADLMLNISVKMVGGKRYSGSNADCDDTEANRCKRSIKRFFDLFGVLVLSDAIPALGWLDLGGYKRSMDETAKELDVLAQGWLEDHRRKRLSCPDGDREQDFMDLMMNVLEGGNFPDFDADTVIKATCLNMIIGGTDTLTVALTWALSLLMNNRRALKKAQQELDTHVGKSRPVEESDVKNLTYLQAIVKETMRLYPPAPMSGPRRSMEECTLSAGFRIPAGTRLLLNIWKIQRDERIWPNPDEFEPERFLTTHENVDMRGHNFELIPFGAGRRSCPGTSLALHTVHLTLASLLQSFEISTVSDEVMDMTESPGLLNMKASPLEVMLIPRLDQKVYQRGE
ncbi:cytochrome P450 CYP82D47-like isoform X2 [Syzygium oleosum]|uniref:cytochrome P450 CYP82D47-like isoform X2 n=1 Tax=Syzygium oleosum TaxID=219896 RepID=UPI0024BBC6CC|nr:cytochrome P450 CYP82D47-like isoform X2 [Syzygium oleosum]